MIKFPDANDRTRNNPCVLLSSKDVLRIYNKEHPNKSTSRKVTHEIIVWFMEKAKEYDWAETNFVGGQCLLKSSFK